MIRLTVGNCEKRLSSLILFVLVVWVGVLGQPKGVFNVVSPIETSFRSVNSGGQMVRSGDDAVIMGWRSGRRGVPYNNIYLQKIDHSGNSFWEPDGTPLCPYPANQTAFSMVEDGFGGVVAVWEDYRHGTEAPAIYAQRINLRGEPLWGLEGLRVCASPGGQRKPKLISDLENGFYVVWEDYRQGVEEPDLYAQLLDLGGRIRWRAQGMPIATAPGIQQNFSVATDEKHFLYIIWEDFRNGIFWNLYAQKLDQAGNFFWKAGGLDVFAGVEENHHNPSIVPDGYGGLLFVYQKYSGETQGTDIYRGRINSAGEVLFHFATCYAQNEQLNPRIVKKGSKAILCWEDRRNGNWDVYAQMVRLHDGILEWDVNGVAVANSLLDEQNPVVITSSSYGYQVFSWSRKNSEGTRIHVQKVNNLGELAWAAGGAEICPYSSEQLEPAILPDEEGGLWCLWSDRQEGASYPVVQHINGNCLPLLQREGLKVTAPQVGVYAKLNSSKLLAARSGDYFVAWQDYRNGYQNADIYLQKLDAKGNSLWRRNGIPACLAKGEQSSPLLIEDGVGGVIVAWYDRRNGKDDNLYAQRIDAYGKLLWKAEGVEVCLAAGDQNSLRAISDGDEGVVLCWVDSRDLAETGFDLYLQRVGHDGEALWGRDGKPFSNFPGLQTGPAMVSDGNGGAFLVWMDARSQYSNIFLQRINSFGIYEWEYGGRATSPAATYQRYPVVMMNEHHELHIVWQESRQGEGYDKLYMQSHTSNGGKLWNPTGVPICKYPGKQSAPQIVAGEAGDFWVTWLDERDRQYLGVQLLVQKFDLGGNAVWQADGMKIGESMDEWNEYAAVANKNGHLVMVWTQRVSATAKHVFCQRLDPDGNKLYGFAGLEMAGADVHQFSPTVAAGAENQIMSLWVQQALQDGVHSIKGFVVK